MEKIDLKIRYVKLIGIYKDLLTHTQSDILVDYFCYDLSYSEIADNRKISRAAVEDAIKKGIKKLEEYEKKLRVLEKNENILKITAEIKKNAANKKDLELIEEIERKVNYGI